MEATIATEETKPKKNQAKEYLKRLDPLPHKKILGVCGCNNSGFGHAMDNDKRQSSFFAEF